MATPNIKNVRYIKTKVDDKNCILHQVNCNHCPFMKFDRTTVTLRCQKYKNLSVYDDLIKKINGYSVGKNGNVSPLGKVDIPNWCQLANTLESVQNDKWVYTKSDIIKYKTEYNDNSRLLVISSNVVIYDDSGNELQIIHKFKNNYAPKSINTDKPNTNTKYIKLDTCSCCGEMKEKIDRNKNIGMCSVCWDKNKDNTEIKNFSYINNFRIKRNKDWIDEKFKKTEQNSDILN